MTVSETLREQCAKVMQEYLAGAIGDTRMLLQDIAHDIDDVLSTAVLSDQAGGWQDISTAKKDIDVLLGWWRTWPERQWEMASGLAGSTKGGWLHGQATHWRPLPAPPPSSSLSGDELK